MYLAYSALTKADDYSESSQQLSHTELQLRYEAYQETCKKYTHEIAAIQKFLPGWMPKFYL